MLGRRLIWIVCALHINELHLRSLVENLDGPTSSSTGFSGPLGKALKNVSSLKLNPCFERIVTNDNLPKLHEEVVNDLSAD